MFGLSEREHAEKPLRETEHLYQALIEAAPDMIFTISPQAGLTSLNPDFERMTGWSRDKWLDKPLHKLVHPEDLSNRPRDAGPRPQRRANSHPSSCASERAPANT